MASKVSLLTPAKLVDVRRIRRVRPGGQPYEYAIRGLLGEVTFDTETWVGEQLGKRGHVG